MDQAILSIKNLSKRFRSNWTFSATDAVRDLSLDVLPGESFGFLGHNGAGKTTTIKCITGLIRQTKGSISFLGQPSSRPDARALLGYLPEQPYFYDHLSVKETIELFAALQGLSGRLKETRSSEVLERVGLATRASSSVRSLSKGLQQRLGLAQAIINKPKLLLLDEPFSGLDPQGRVEVRELLLELKSSGTTIFLSSHILSDISELCDRVAIMSRGCLESLFELRDAARLFGEEYELVVARNDNQQAITKLETQAKASKLGYSPSSETIVFSFQDYQDASSGLAYALEQKLQVLSFRATPKSLEEIFLQITNSSKEEGNE